ncbi:MAG: hypothetical protein J7527_01700 [Chitinophagaceae bacterium]|nr:hypothetical protein [Chitinophagaceae bacterium]
MCEEMEMPCVCDCGKVFDLNDGYGSLEYGNKTVICKSCHASQEERERLREQIKDLEYEMDLTGKGRKREIAKLRKELDKLGGPLNDF